MFRLSMSSLMVAALLTVGCAASSSGDTQGASDRSKVRTAAKTSKRTTGPGHNKRFEGMTIQETVEATERAFAKTMADRNFEAFRSFLSDEAIFMSGSRPLRGKQRVAQEWQKYFETPEAPFSWVPQRVVVLESEGLAFSSGPVTGSDGSALGSYSSIWKLESDGLWRIIFDQGS